jgi:hypothetical protein
MHDFITLDGPLCRGECSEPQPRIHVALHKPMVLFYHIIQVLTLSEPTGFRKCTVVLESVEGQWARRVLVDGDDARERRRARVQHLPEKLFGGVGITGGTSHDVQRGPRRVDGPVKVVPLLLDLDVRLIDAV